MNGTTLRNVISLSVLGLILSTVMVFAQDNKASDAPKANPDGSYTSSKHNEADRPEDSYLAKFHAQEVVHKLISRNLDQIYLLKVIVGNFSDKGWKEDYDKVYAEYKKALDFYYKRNIIYSRVELENNRKHINDLLKKISDDYKQTTLKMLEECAEKILMLNLDASTKSDPNKYRELQQNEMRLHIAYGQFDDAVSSATSLNYETSLYHFRVAKTYGIRILEDLNEDQKKVSDTYKKDKADNMNRIFEEAKGASAAPAGEKKAQ